MEEEKNSLIYRLLRFTIFYKAYQNLVTKKNTYTFIYQEIFNFQENSIVLDCGCGPAHYRDLINTNDYTGVDFNKNHIMKAKKKFPLDKFIHGDVLNVDIASGGPYSEIILFGLLHHLNDKNVRTLLDNLILNLKMEGKIMSIDPVYVKSDLNLYTKIANFIASKDQGNYVRTEKGYKNLFNSMNLTIKTKVYKNLLRIPFFHNVMHISHK
mgnify:CR=1 FL=1